MRGRLHRLAHSLHQGRHRYAGPPRRGRQLGGIDVHRAQGLLNRGRAVGGNQAQLALHFCQRRLYLQHALQLRAVAEMVADLGVVEQFTIERGIEG